MWYNVPHNYYTILEFILNTLYRIKLDIINMNKKNIIKKVTKLKTRNIKRHLRGWKIAIENEQIILHY